MPMDLRMGDVVRLKKPHPCGSYEWVITRLGADIGLRCLGCGRRVLLARSKVEKRIKAVKPAPGAPAESETEDRRPIGGKTTGR